MSRNRGLVTGIVVGAVGTLVLLAAAGLVVVYTGAYDVAATDRHLPVVRWALTTTMERSVAARAADVRLPESFSPEMVAAGAEMYGSTCVHCHGGPGVERADWASAMRPMPPELVHAAEELEPREVFWIAKHGLKMTGMPAFGANHGDDALRDVAAFVKELAGMTPERFRELTGGAGHDEAGHGHSGDGR